MKVAVVGDPAREKEDLILLQNLGEEVEASYFKISEILFWLGKSIALKHNQTSLSSFDFVFPVPTSRYADVFLILLKSLEFSRVRLPFSSSSFLLLQNKCLAFELLRNKGIETRLSLLIASNQPVEKLVKRIKFPVLVKYAGKRVRVNNQEVLEDVVSLPPIGTPIEIVTPLHARKIVWALVANGEALTYQKTKGSYKKIEREKLKKQAEKARQVIGCNFLGVKFLQVEKKWLVADLSFSPKFSQFEFSNQELKFLMHKLLQA